MKVHLLHPSGDFDPEQALPEHAQALIDDLELETLFTAMAADEDQVREVVRKVILTNLQDADETIAWRQAIVRDCLAQPEAVRELYALAVATIEQHKSFYWSFLSNYPSSILHGAISIMDMFSERLRQLRDLAAVHAEKFHSPGFTQLFAMLARELDDAYLQRIQDDLEELRFHNGDLFSAGLGPGNAGSGYTLRRLGSKRHGWLQRLFEKAPSAFTFRLAERDQAGARALRQLQDRGLNEVANVLAQSSDHVLNFFHLLSMELAFYVGCINLHEQLQAWGAPTCLPQPAVPSASTCHGEGLYDIGLALSMKSAVVGNTLAADGKPLVVITGANQGGKSSFLRAVGLAHLMLQAGMFVGAETFVASPCSGLYTHYRREEDRDMQSGKFDEELARLSAMVEHLKPDSLVLFNESFASTNEREGSEIARQVVCALLQARMRVCFVTHLYTFAHDRFDAMDDDAVFLRAERREDGSRSFKLRVAEPRQTSYGQDLYRQVFGEDAEVVT